MHVIKVLCINLLVFTLCSSNQLDPSLIAASIEHISTNALGVQFMQDYLDNDVTFNSYTADGRAITDQLAASLQEKFKSRFQLAWNLKNKIEASLDDFTTTNQHVECCHTQPSLEYNSRFQGYVHTDKYCPSISTFADKNPTFIPEAVIQQFKNNYEKETDVKWQYFGMESGVSFHFPASVFSSCGDYDPRFRTWYVETATPFPKDIVMIIDKSGSMGTVDYESGMKRMDIAKEAATSVISTLNHKDRVGVVSFSDYAEAAYQPVGTYGSEQCYKTELALGTAQSKAILNLYIEGLENGGMTYYERAMMKAYELFQSTPEDTDYPDREKVILFLTDGDSTDGDKVIDVMEEKHPTLFGNNITVMTYGIGDISKKDLLEDMASTATNKAGEFSMITDTKTLRHSMASYYKLFGDNSLERPVVSMPYIDAFGLGLMTTVSLPVYGNGGSFIGVVGVDITLADLLADVDYLNKGVDSYGFVMNKVGEVLAHPLLPRPISVEDAPVLVKITDLEQDPAVDTAVSSMKARASDSAEMSLTRYISRGDVTREGVLSWMQASYVYWSPINDTDFSLAVVLGSVENWAEMQVDVNQNVPFTYHNLSLIGEANPITTCRHFTREAINTDTVVKFGAKAFTMPFRYLDTQETTETVEQYAKVVKGLDSSPVLTSEARKAVTVSAHVHHAWFGEIGLSTDSEMYSVWRYIALDTGVLRMYPGTSLSKEYDPTARPWYLRSVAYKGKTVISAPYLDAFGAGYVVTLSKALRAGNQREEEFKLNSTVIGVMGIDFTVNFLYYNMMVNYPVCKEEHKSCFLLDVAGYIVIHREFITVAGVENPVVENIHITNKERSVARHMIQQGYMVRRSCVDVYNIYHNFYYEMYVSEKKSHWGGSPSYEIYPVQDSNLYLVISEKDNQSPPCLCAGSAALHKCEADFLTSDCPCPCFSSANFQLCRNEFTVLHGSERATLCTPKLAPLDVQISYNDELERMKEFPACWEPRCEEKTKEETCYYQSECNWCRLDAEGEEMEQPFCGHQYTCFFGQVGYQNPYDIFHEILMMEDGLSLMMIIIIVGTIVLFLAISLFIFFKWVKKCLCGDPATARATREEEDDEDMKLQSMQTGTGPSDTTNPLVSPPFRPAKTTPNLAFFPQQQQPSYGPQPVPYPPGQVPQQGPLPYPPSQGPPPYPGYVAHQYPGQTST